MAETGSQWDQEDGYDFLHEEGDVDVAPEHDETDSDPVVRNSLDIEKMHHSFPETHDYLQQSLQDIDFITDRIRSMQSDEHEEPDEQVQFKRRRKKRPNPTIEEDQLSSNKEFKERRIKRRAMRRIKDKLRKKGYSEKFIAEHRDYIQDRVEEFLES